MSSNPLPLFPQSHPRGLAILDGGLGTTLEQTFGLDISHTPLWSAKAAIEHPETIINAHLAFLRAGAQIILTSTYQCSMHTFERGGYSQTDAHKIMLDCVQLAAEAKARFRKEVPEAPPVKIALSLGPFGAGLSPAQEFDGYYPPPYGPRAYTSGDLNRNRNAFPRDAEGQEKEADATAALARFHFERLCVFADDEAAWDALDCIAFETVPLVREIRAIRRAVALLEARGCGKKKPWWISFVFPGGRFPEAAAHDEPDGRRVDVRSVVAAATGDFTSEHLPVPSALGINCTEMETIPGILNEVETALRDTTARPWLVIYPNGGDTYDSVSQTWVVNDKGGIWAEKFAEIVAKIPRGPADVWAGAVAGGCCRTGPEDIKLLSEFLICNADDKYT